MVLGGARAPAGPPLSPPLSMAPLPCTPELLLGRPRAPPTFSGRSLPDSMTFHGAATKLSMAAAEPLPGRCQDAP
jgi:hypothetical protein